MIRKNIQSVVSSENGRTLIEIIASIAVLAIIIIPFTSMFVQSAKTLNKSDEIMDATYVAQSIMEEVYHISTTESFNNDQITAALTGESIVNEGQYYRYNRDDYFIELSLKPLETNDDLVTVLVKVFSDESAGKLEAQMETILSWES